MRTLEEKLPPDAALRHVSSGLFERERTRIRLASDGTEIGEISHARHDRRESWLIRPAGFPVFVPEPGSRYARGRTGKRPCVDRLLQVHALRDRAVDASGTTMVPFGHVGGGNSDAATDLYVGVEAGAAVEIRVAERRVAAAGYVAGWEGFGARGAHAVFAMGCASMEEALEVVLRIRRAPLGFPTETWGRKVAGHALLAFGSLVDLARPDAIPVRMHAETDPEGITHVSPRPGETLYRIVPSDGGLEVLPRVGPSLGSVGSLGLALSMLGVPLDEPDSEPGPGPAP